MMKCETALEVACGAAHCTKMVLSKKFYKIDLFDESQGAVTDAMKNLEGVERVGQVAKSRMQDYTFDEKYNCILLRYCVGYLTDDELVVFLKKAAENLVGQADEQKRVASLKSFILVQDQVCPSEKYC